MASGVAARKSRLKSPADSVGAYFDRIEEEKPGSLNLFTSGTDEEFENAFTVVIERAVRHLEKNKKLFDSLDEEGLTAALAGVLMIPDFTVTQETHSNGHVDVTIEVNGCSPARVKLGEAKIYKGPKYHMKGVAQLLGRYTTGREMAGLMISYVRRKNIEGITASLRAALNRALPENQIGPCKNRKLKWSFETKHRHGSGVLVCVEHVGCNLGP